ncbi:MAG TPA: ribulose-phosphate 3-epimerase [Bacilli bacterium]|nr:ribulose-phosphate 3-epimerase [Bacilli bacterium]
MIFIKVSVSFLKSKYSHKETINLIENSNCDYIHVDVMDGNFVVTKTEDLIKYLINSKKKLDVHLMVEEPLDYINDYAKLNVEYITIHSEINKDLSNLIDYIHSLNIKCGLAINPETDINKIEPYLSKIDQVLIMSVHPGAGGQKFIDSSIDKINILDNLRSINNYKYIINIDGGVNKETISAIKKTNIDMVVSGSFITLSDNYQTQIDILKKSC